MQNNIRVPQASAGLVYLRREWGSKARRTHAL